MINKKYLINLRSKEIYCKNDFIFDLYCERIIDSLEIITIHFKHILILGQNGTKLNTYLRKRFKDGSFTIYDYTEFDPKDNNLNFYKNSIDMDVCKIDPNKYDLILSNFFCI